MCMQTYMQIHKGNNSNQGGENSMKCLPYKHDDLNLILRAQQNMATEAHTPVIILLWRTRQRDPARLPESETSRVTETLPHYLVADPNTFNPITQEAEASRPL